MIAISQVSVSEESGISHDYSIEFDKPTRLLEYGGEEKMANVGHFHHVGKYRRHLMLRLAKELSLEHVGLG